MNTTNTPRKLTVAELTSNQFYGGLNRRFEKRASILRRLGFTYQIIPDGVGHGTLAIFSRPDYRRRDRHIQAAAVMHCTNRAWICQLAITLCH